LSEIAQGLSLSWIGILITFSALGILIGLILLLKGLFPELEGRNKGKGTLGEIDQPHSPDRERLLKTAAAAGVAVLLKRKESSGPGTLGKLLEKPAAGWWQKGVDRAHRKE